MNQGILSVLSRSVSTRQTVGQTPPDGSAALSIRSRRVPEMAIGLALVIGGALGALTLFQSATDSVTVVSTSRLLPRGHVIAAGDLVAMEVAKQTAQIFVSAKDARMLIGKSVAINIPAATPLHISMLVNATPLDTTEALSSAAVAVGDYPPTLAPGDRVQVVFAPDVMSGSVQPPAVYRQVVTVWAITPTESSQSSAVITLRGPTDLALAIAGSGKVHLALLGAAASTERP